MVGESEFLCQHGDRIQRAKTYPCFLSVVAGSSPWYTVTWVTVMARPQRTFWSKQPLFCFTSVLACGDLLFLHNDPNTAEHMSP